MSTSASTQQGAPIKRKAAQPPVKKPSTTRNSDVDAPQAQTAFEKLFENLLKDVYWAEQHLAEALQIMSAAATAETLHAEEHLHETQRHVSRLEKAFSFLGKDAEAEKSGPIGGLIDERNQGSNETLPVSLPCDAGLIIAAQKTGHYDIAAYGRVRTPGS